MTAESNIKTILITGASGFIGKEVCRTLSLIYKTVGLEHSKTANYIDGVKIFSINILDKDALNKICIQYNPDIVIHCAAIAHQGFLRKSKNVMYEKINSVATENLAIIVARLNPKVHFIFLSSISVYGEKLGHGPIKEDIICIPTSDYARSKLGAEKRLEILYQRGKLQKLDILRLAPVYDRMWTQNLDKRVLDPFKCLYLRYGNGTQKLSALARGNLIGFLIHRLSQASPHSFFNVINVCDSKAYSFNEIIQAFQQSHYQPSSRVLGVDLRVVKLLVNFVGFLHKQKTEWVQSFYHKLANDFVFDTTRMYGTGYMPSVTLDKVFKK